MGGQNQGPEAPPRSKKRGSKRDVRRGAMEKGGCAGSLRGRRSEEMTQSNTSPWGSEGTLESQRG